MFNVLKRIYRNYSVKPVSSTIFLFLTNLVIRKTDSSTRHWAYIKFNLKSTFTTFRHNNEIYIGKQENCSFSRLTVKCVYFNKKKIIDEIDNIEIFSLILTLPQLENIFSDTVLSSEIIIIKEKKERFTIKF